MSDIFGLGSPTPFAFFDPDSSSWRMSQATLDLGSTPSSPTLPAWGEMHDGALSERPTPAHLTGGRDFSSHHTLPTPRAAMGDDRNSVAWVRPAGPQNLENAIGEIALLPTLTARLGTPRGAQAARYLDLWMSEQTGNGSGLPSDSGRPSWDEQRLPLSQPARNSSTPAWSNG